MFSFIVQQERQLLSENGEEVKVLAIGNSNTFGNGASTGKRLTKGNGKFGKPNLGKVCNFYGKTGHTVEICFKKHGLPPNFK